MQFRLMILVSDRSVLVDSVKGKQRSGHSLPRPLTPLNCSARATHWLLLKGVKSCSTLIEMAKQSPLRLLAETILSAVSHIDAQFEAAGLEFPSLNEPFNPFDPTTGLLFHPEVSTNGAVIIAAAEQLLVSVRPPPLVVLENAIAVSGLDLIENNI